VGLFIQEAALIYCKIWYTASNTLLVPVIRAQLAGFSRLISRHPALDRAPFVTKELGDLGVMPLTTGFDKVKSHHARCGGTVSKRLQFVFALSLVCSPFVPSEYAAPPSGSPADKAAGSPSSARSRRAESRKQDPQAARRPAGVKLVIKVVDETGVAVPSALVTLEGPGAQKLLKGETDYAGRAEFAGLDPGAYKVKIEKEGFYAKVTDETAADDGQSLEVVLDHQQELKEVMDVPYSPPVIDPAKTAATEHLNSQEIINVPYPASRDIKQAFVLMPGIVKDRDGNFHVSGARTDQTQDQIDGFNANNPASGTINLHVSADAVRSIETLTSSYSAEHGKGSGGLVGLATGMGDDRLRFSATNFLPSFQGQKGFNINDWTPRATISGPIIKRRAWFFDAADGQYKLNIVNQLPAGGDRDFFWEMSNLSKAQVNVTESNILSGSFLFNDFHEDRNGLSPLNPVGTTINLRQSAYMVWLRDQQYLSNGILMEVGLALSRYHTDGTPQGSQPLFLTPEGSRGSFFKTSADRSGRAQLAANAIFPMFNWKGHHQIKAGVDVDHLNVDERSERRPTLIQREDQTLAREITFVGTGLVDVDTMEESAYVLDRWQVSDRLLVNGGFRLDRDDIVAGMAVSPRLAASLLLTSNGDTKLTAGAGVFYDAANLGLLARAQDAQRLDASFDLDGKTLASSPVLVSFQAQERLLTRPRYLNLDLGLERRLPASFYVRASVLIKRGGDGFAFVNLFEPPVFAPGIAAGAVRLVDPRPVGAQFLLANVGRDRYRAAELTLRRSFRQGYEFFASYVRSGARSNAVIDFNIDSPILSRQQGGPLPWDSPNRLIGWGWLPLVKKFTVAYFAEWRDGYPFSVMDENQQLVGAPGSRRFPPYFSLDIHVERRFRFLKYNLAVRAGFNDITNRHNPNLVNNNIDSPSFLTFSSAQHRSFTARLRFLGKK